MPDAFSSAPPVAADTLMLRLDGFEGPLDLLLDLARAQKVNLARISILALVNQYIAIMDSVRQLRLELAAEWLVMAAWLTWLKSRLLLPPEAENAAEAEQAAGDLTARLHQLELTRAAAAWLAGRAQLGHDVFARGAPERLTEQDRTRLRLDVPALLRAYVSAATRAAAQRCYTPRTVTVWSVEDAVRRLRRTLGTVPDWSVLEQYIPGELRDPVQWRAAMASTLLAGLELARSGAVRLRQDRPFGPVLVSAAVPVG